jgi:hypothetical protein
MAFQFHFATQKIRNIGSMFGGLCHSSEGRYPTQSSAIRFGPVQALACAGVTAIFCILAAHYCYCEQFAKIAGEMVRSAVEIVLLGA